MSRGTGFKYPQGTNFQNKNENVTFELLRCSYSHIWQIYEPSIGMVYEPLIGSGCRAETGIIVPIMETYQTNHNIDTANIQIICKK